MIVIAHYWAICPKPSLFSKTYSLGQKRSLGDVCQSTMASIVENVLFTNGQGAKLANNLLKRELEIDSRWLTDYIHLVLVVFWSS